MDECDVSVSPEHAMCAPGVRRTERSLSLRPEIVLTSPSEITEEDDGVRMPGHLEASMDILSRKLIQESLATVAVFHQYSDKIPFHEKTSSTTPQTSLPRTRSSRL